MIEYYKSHPALAVLMAALIIFAVIVFIKAVVSSEKRAKKNQEIIKKLEADKKLREKFTTLTAELISSADSVELFRGVGFALQKRVADKSDMNAEFDLLTDGQKCVYSMLVLADESEKALSDFFRANGRPLTDYALKASEIIGAEFAETVKFEYDAYDSDNEEVSCIPAEITEADKKAAPFISDGTVSKLMGEYIKANPAEFI
ncbi:MAG: hypothetical protein IK097_05320 [Clostridia bacterium]|nr:hypothetical protein [Clostridia bacterium]